MNAHGQDARWQDHRSTSVLLLMGGARDAQFPKANGFENAEPLATIRILYQYLVGDSD